jgi:hypothetical protein
LRAGAALTAVAVVLAGCGGDGGGLDKTVDAGPPPEPEESISAFAGRLASAIEAGRQGDCKELKALSKSGAMQLNCDRRARKAFAGFKVTDTATYGTGGVVEFVDAETKDPKLAAGVTTSAEGARGVYTVAIDPRGRWSFTGPVSPVLPGPTIGTKPASIAGPARAARDFAAAVERSDCALFYKVTLTPGLDQQKACGTILGDYAPLAKELKEQDDDAKPRALGGNATFTFFALRTGQQYRTLVVFKNAPGEEQPYLVMGAFKGPS